jgi:hypothetical protein
MGRGRSLSGPSFPRRQQYRHTAAAVGYATAAVFALGLALELATNGDGTLALLLTITAGGLALRVGGQ